MNIVKIFALAETLPKIYYAARHLQGFTLAQESTKTKYALCGGSSEPDDENPYFWLGSSYLSTEELKLMATGLLAGLHEGIKSLDAQIFVYRF